MEKGETNQSPDRFRESACRSPSSLFPTLMSERVAAEIFKSQICLDTIEFLLIE